MTALSATLRLQFHSGFRFDDARALIPYFLKLGVSHIYASPVLQARPGSTYGYDMVDPTRVNEELGGEESLRQFAEALHKEHLGLIVDFVPNHMAVGGASNPWWLSVLEWGQRSPYARFFDINWNSPDPLLTGQLLVPFLRTDYGEVLVSGELPLRFAADTGHFFFEHFEHRFPLYPPTYGDILNRAPQAQVRALGRRFKALDASPAPFELAKDLHQALSQLAQQPEVAQGIAQAISAFTVPVEENTQATHHPISQPTARHRQIERAHRLLELQHYRLASWRTAADDINWRRFFDINELGALSTERGDVFEAIHAKLFELIADGVIDGLRIDHVDGLANPRAYCRKLRRRTRQLRPGPQHAGDGFAIYVEKILGDEEQLPSDWLVDGTTGYEFMNQVSLLQHDPLGALQLRGLWQELSHRPASFRDEMLEARRLILSSTLAGDLERLAHQLLLVARTDIATRDLTLGAIRRALFELIVYFPVYRTYSAACSRSAQEQAFFEQALAGAKSSLQESDWPLLAYLDQWLGGQPLHELPPGRMRRLRRKALAHFQQLTSPTAAKAVEDTACYRSAVLLSRNDVGFDPARFSTNPSQFHQWVSARAATFPHNLLATATHDHKRGEDTRARLAVVSERSAWFARKVQEWRTLAQAWRKELDDGLAPSAGDELALYQTLLGSWPLDLTPNDREGLEAYSQRLLMWQEKAIREAKLRSRWTSPNQAYESACREFLTHVFQDEAAHKLLAQLQAAAMELAVPGALNSLGQTLLRLTSPGVPDLYQGCEYWDFSLVDPDNRRPVDYEPRMAAMEACIAPGDLVLQWRNGYIKQYIIRKTLGLRTIEPEIFRQGDYLPLELQGTHSDRLLAFARHWRDRWVVVLVPRLVANLLGDSENPLVPADQWGDTRLNLPPQLADSPLVSLFSNRCFPPGAGSLEVRELLADFPVNLLYLSLAPEVNHANQ